MEFVKETPFFDKAEKKIKKYNYLDDDLSTDILIVGGGIDGAILNYFLSQKYDVSLVEAYRLGRSSTSIATALLEYQLDEFANELKKYLCEKDIVDIYKMGLNGIDTLEKIISKLGN